DPERATRLTCAHHQKRGFALAGRKLEILIPSAPSDSGSHVGTPAHPPRLAVGRPFLRGRASASPVAGRQTHHLGGVRKPVSRLVAASFHWRTARRGPPRAPASSRMASPCTSAQSFTSMMCSTGDPSV